MTQIERMEEQIEDAKEEMKRTTSTKRKSDLQRCINKIKRKIKLERRKEDDTNCMQ